MIESTRCECCRRRRATVCVNAIWCCRQCADAERELETTRDTIQMLRPTEKKIA